MSPSPQQFTPEETRLLVEAAYARWADRGPVAVAWEPRTAHLVLAALQTIAMDPFSDTPAVLRAALEQAGRQLQELIADDDHIRALLEQGWDR
jgi:hypothetical protein